MSDSNQMFDQYPLAAVPGYTASKPGIQIGTQLPPDAAEETIEFVKQLGVEWIMTSLPEPLDGPVTGPEPYAAVRERFENYGLSVYRIANHRCHNMASVTLNLPDRDEKVEEFLQYIRDLGASGFRYATYAHMANGIWSSEPETMRGGAKSRAFRLDTGPVGHWRGESWQGELTHGREYEEEELWENYTYFIRKVVPVAEEAGVRIGIHPDDPPVYSLGGIPRCMFGTFDGYQRALDIADSPNIGVCLCVGCWLEGGDGMGKSAVDAIKSFGKAGKLFKVHFRNVTAPLPEGFVETYLDNGYMSMVRIMAALHEVGFDGAVISDHLPQMSVGRLPGEGYSIGYIRGLIDSVTASPAV